MSLSVNGTDIKKVIINNTELNKVIINNTEVWTGIPEWDTRGLNYNSWDTIQKYIQAGLFAEKVSVGDTKNFTINNKTYKAEVVAINDGTGDASDWYPDKTVDFVTVECYEQRSVVNGSASNTGGYPSSSIRSWLNSTLYTNFDADLKNVIIKKSHSYQSGSWHASASYWQPSMTTCSDKLWLPTYYEATGYSNYYAPGENQTNNKRYTIANKLKYINGTTNNYGWWLASPYTELNMEFWYGGVNTNNAYANASLGLAIGFRIG